MYVGRVGELRIYVMCNQLRQGMHHITREFLLPTSRLQHMFYMLCNGTEVPMVNPGISILLSFSKRRSRSVAPSLPSPGTKPDDRAHTCLRAGVSTSSWRKAPTSATGTALRHAHNGLRAAACRLKFKWGMDCPVAACLVLLVTMPTRHPASSMTAPPLAPAHQSVSGIGFFAVTLEPSLSTHVPDASRIRTASKLLIAFCRCAVSTPVRSQAASWESRTCFTGSMTQNMKGQGRSQEEFLQPSSLIHLRTVRRRERLITSSSQLRADQMPGPPREVLVMHELFLDRDIREELLTWMHSCPGDEHAAVCCLLS